MAITFDGINGYGHLIIKFYPIPGGKATNTETFNLPVVGSEGFRESKQERKIVHDLLNYDIEEDLECYRLSWTLSWEEYSNKALMMMLQEIDRMRKRKMHTMWLIPHADVPQRKFEVVYTGDSLDYSLLTGAGNAYANKGAVIQYTTKHPVDDYNWIDPTLIQYAVWADDWSFIPETA
jgi:hypothetical protein